MTYTVGVPFDGQSLGNSKPQVRANFSDLFTWAAKNHFALNTANAGKHQFIEMPNVANQVTVADECGLYGQSLGTTPFANMVWQQETGGADPLRNMGSIIQMTGIVPKITGNSGWTFLPGGLLIQWDTVSTSTGANSKTYPTPFKGGTQPMAIIATLNENPSTIVTFGADTRTSTTFELNRFGGVGTLSVFYIAIGISP
jgi:hypothetical protein